MAELKNSESDRLQQASLRTSQVGYLFIGIYAASTFIYKSWKLLTPDILSQRWLIILLLLVINTTLLFFSRKPRFQPLYYQGIIFMQICMYIAVGTYSIYSERGMASNAIILFAIPLVVVALEYSGKALMLVTTLCALCYSGAAVKYFRNFPSEGYKVELYGGIVFYVAILYLISALLWILVRSKANNQTT